jgi:two-component system sensor histidine kinase QseC
MAPPEPQSAPASGQARSHSLQGRLVALVLSVVTAAWLIAALLIWSDTEHELEELLDGHLAQAAALLVAQQSPEFDDDALEDAPSLHRYAPRVAFQFWHEGVLVLRSANAPAEPMSTLERGFETGRIGDDAWRVFATRGKESDVQVFVGERIEAREDILGALIRNLFMPLALVLPLLALALWWAVRVGLAPLRQLAAVLHRRGPQALDTLHLPTSFVEMAPLLDALNRLFERIAELLEQERRFNADAAHELTTPIAAIRAQAQVALRESDATLRQHALRATLAGCDRASHLVAQLLQLSRIESAADTDTDPEAGASHAALDLSALTRSVLADLNPAARARQQSIELDAPAHCSARGDATLLGVLMRNLVDNAIRYSPPGTPILVTISTGQPGAAPSWQIDDGGPGLGDADLARLGERFFRVLGHDAPGSGLGWSIVRRIARALGLTLRAERSHKLGGLAVRLIWPQPGAEPGANVAR